MGKAVLLTVNLHVPETPLPCVTTESGNFMDVQAALRASRPQMAAPFTAAKVMAVRCVNRSAQLPKQVMY